MPIPIHEAIALYLLTTGSALYVWFGIGALMFSDVRSDVSQWHRGLVVSAAMSVPVLLAVGWVNLLPVTRL